MLCRYYKVANFLTGIVYTFPLIAIHIEIQSIVIYEIILA
jgi:hypothetical protein